MVETPAGRANQVPLDARSAQTVGVGDLVSIATPPETPVRPADRQIAEAARARGGVFAVDPSTGSDAQGLARRLRDLERAGLVAAEGPARWRVPSDLSSTGSPSGHATRQLATGSLFAKSPCRSRSRSSTGDRSGSIASIQRR